VPLPGSAVQRTPTAALAGRRETADWRPQGYAGRLYKPVARTGAGDGLVLCALASTNELQFHVNFEERAGPQLSSVKALGPRAVQASEFLSGTCAQHGAHRSAMGWRWF